MDVRIGEIAATIIDTDAGGPDDATVERIARRVIAMLDRRDQTRRNAATDCRIASTDHDDVERYG